MKKGLTVLLAAVMLLMAVLPAAAVGESYTAALSPARQEVSLGETVRITVNISGGSAYNAADLRLSYDAGRLEFVQAASQIPGSPRITNEQGSLDIRLYGGKNALDSVFTLAFKVISTEGEAAVRLLSARVDKGENASLQDAPEARITNAEAIVVCQPERFAVTLPEWFEGLDYALKGLPYEFKAKDKNYLYTFTGSTMGGSAIPLVKDDENGVFRIPQATGEIIIRAERTPKTFRVSFTGTARPDLYGAGSATYLEDYTFTLQREDKYEYSQPLIYIGGKRFTGYSASGDSFTIPGKAITGRILISVDKNQTEEEKTTMVKFVGSGAGAAKGPAGAVIGKDYTFTLSRTPGYEYTISATMGGKTVSVRENGDGSYTIRQVTGPLEIRIERTAQMTVSVYQYLKLSDARHVYLIKLEAPTTAGEAYTYEGNVMYRSEKYGAYVYLALSPQELAKFKQQVPQKLGMAAAEAPLINYTGEPNTAAIRALYHAGAEFDPQQMAKYLAADLNGTHCVDIMDAVMAVYRRQ